jgi:hypothetical protein
MKRKYISLLVAAVILAFTACTPEEYDMGSAPYTTDDLKEGIAFDYTIDQTTNTVSFTTKDFIGSENIVSWDFSGAGNGYVQKRNHTFQIPFGGNYTVYFGVITKGGYVKSEPIEVIINNTNGSLLTDPLWTLLSGGVGNSKEWVIDLDANGVSKFFTGPMYFYGTADSWETVTNGQKLANPPFDSWNWNPVWADNSWLTAAKDFGSMTFDLKNGANVSVNDLDNAVNFNGTYLMDTENHTISLTNADILHLSSQHERSTNWRSNLKIMSLTENTMQIASLRDNPTPGDGPCLLVFNYITKAAYNDPSILVIPTTGVTDTPVTDPVFENLNGQLTTTVTTSMNYKINEEAPYDWLWWNSANGTWESNGFATNADYPTWAPLPAAADNFALMLNAGVDASGKPLNEFILNSTDDVSYDGNYTVTSNKLTFNKPITLLTASNSTRQISIDGTEFYVMKIDEETGEVWLGEAAGVDAKGKTNKYICVRLIPQKSSTPTGPTKVIVDNSKVPYGYVENEEYLRIEFFNVYGSDAIKANPPINATKIKFSSQLSVTFTISGLGTLSESTTATIGMTGSGTDQQFKEAAIAMPNRTNATVTGDGTYTVKYSTDTKISASATDFVFVIDMLIAGKTDVDLSIGDGIQCPNINVTINEITVE